MKIKFLLSSYTLLLLILLLISFTKSDLPVHCLVSDIEGEWTLRIKDEKFDAESEDIKTSCGHGLPNKVDKTEGETEFTWEKFYDLKLTLDKNYKVYEEGNLVGNWTPVYDQSFVIFYKEAVITAPYKYYKSNGEYKSQCNKSMVGWFIPDKNENRKNWSCFYAFKSNSNNFLGESFLQIKLKQNVSRISVAQINLHKTLKYEQLKNVVDEINKAGLLWKAEVHDEFKGLTLMELKRKLGLRKSLSEWNDNYLLDTGGGEVAGLFDRINLPSVSGGSHSKINFIQMSSNDLLDKDKVEIQIDSESDLEEFFRKLDAEAVLKEKEKEKIKKGHSKKFNSKSKSKFTSKSKSKIKQQHQFNFTTQYINNTDDTLRDKDSSEVFDYSEISKYINTPLEEIPENKLPRNWDWRNVGGVNYIPSVKRQGNCGSCYVFSTITSLEARLRIQTNNKDKTEFSKQYPISCNFYSEGCDGGYPFLVGKFFNEFEIVPEECYPYTQTNGNCNNVCDYKNRYTKKYRVSSYGYIGGYYGATNEILMMKELRARGPIPGNIKVPYTFNYYKKGIFSQSEVVKNSDRLSKTTMVDRHLSWEKVEHSVTLIGYGEENGFKYWIGLNTWGGEWGENGTFKILRGENECSIESMGDVIQIEVSDR